MRRVVVTSRRATLALAPAAALVAWLCLLAILNVTTHPFVSAGAFAGLALLAVRTGHARLVGVSLLVGVGLLLVIPGLALTSGRLSISLVPGATAVDPTSPGQLAYAALAALRVPAQVLASVLLLLVPAPELLGWLSRLAPRTVIVAGLATRLGPLLTRDATMLRDELRGRGERFGSPAPWTARVGAMRSLWDSLVGGVFDRAFDTAAALHARGHGATTTTGALRHPRLVPTRGDRRRLDRALAASAWLTLVAVVAARIAGELPAAEIRMFAGVEQPPSIVAWVLGIGAFLIGLIPAFASRSSSVPCAPDGPVSERRLGVPAFGCSSQAARIRVGPGDVPYLDGVSTSRRSVALRIPQLDLEPGTCTLLLGPSGSGKSTLLATIRGGVPLHPGASYIDGQPVIELEPAARVRRIGAVFQDPERQSVMDTVLEEVALGARNAGLPLHMIAERVVDVLDDLGCAHLAGRMCASLSGGELQLVLLAASLVTEPGVLLLDEPTSQLDAAAAERFWTALDRVRKRRPLTVVVAEHRLEHAVIRADRILILDHGEVRFDGDPREATDAWSSLRRVPYAGIEPLQPGHARPIGLVTTGLSVRVPGRGDTPGRLTVRDLSLALPRGSVLAVTGENGAGKSTLLRSMRGLVPAAAGGLWVDGMSVTPATCWQLPIAYLSQYAATTLCAGSVLAELRARVGSSPPDESLRAALRDAGLADVADAHPHDLAAGERQRLAILATTLMPKPLWLFDEPTRGLDSTGRLWLGLVVSRHMRAGGIAVIATHDEHLVDALSTHRLRLGNGSGVASRTAHVDVAVPRIELGEGVV